MNSTPTLTMSSQPCWSMDLPAKSRRAVQSYFDGLEREVYTFSAAKLGLFPDLRKRAAHLLKLIRWGAIDLEDAERQLGDLQLAYSEAMGQ